MVIHRNPTQRNRQWWLHRADRLDAESPGRPERPRRWPALPARRVWIDAQLPPALAHWLTREYGVDAVFSGHDESYQHSVVDGIHFVNTGSVGRPKDGDPRAGYVRLTLGEGDALVEHVRVPYDVEGAVEAVVRVVDANPRHGGTNAVRPQAGAGGIAVLSDAAVAPLNIIAPKPSTAITAEIAAPCRRSLTISP